MHKNITKGILKARLLRNAIMAPFVTKKREDIFAAQEKKGINSIPIFIINFNRLSYLKQQIEFLEKVGMNNIYIVDNASSYPPLLDYYNSTKHQVIFLKKNYGHMAMWEAPELEPFRENFYVVTDPDVIPIDNCPTDFMEKFFYALKKYRFVRKVGFSLQLKDIPKDGVFYNEVMRWETQFYDIYLKKDNLFYAAIDTTFALYLPDILASKTPFLRAFRTGHPYQARHLPWYKKKKDVLTEEEIYYSDTKKNGWWNPAKQHVTPDEKNTKIG